MGEDHILLLGEIKGKLDQVIQGQNETKQMVTSMDGRLRKVETKATVLGAGAGALVSVGIAIMVEKGKRTIGL
ncbi:MAG: hypothetical protein KBF68_03745 [Nitrosomonas sp.]|jgi:hypothetical protein|nr:hypothetical protein [Nitrosomonas sp.]